MTVWAFVVLIVALAILWRIPPDEVPEVIRAFGAWLHVSVCI
jgi:hypothetical protein